MKQDRSWTEIDLTNFEHNLNQLKALLPFNTEFMQIVKADAYGHGAYEIARKAIECGATFLGVANAQEGMLLRYQGIDIPILILSPSLTSELKIILDYDLIPTISDLDFATKLNETTKTKIQVHVNVDTGMGRSGVPYLEALELIEKIESLPDIQIQGIFSHFSSAEDDIEFTKKQSDRFEQILSKLKMPPKFIHIANSSGVVSIKCDYANLVRIGLLSFGIYADDSQKTKVALKPVMTFKSRIGQIKRAVTGDFIGYNKTYKVEKQLKYAIIPVGYADGYDFLLSNKGKVVVNDILCNVIGKVSMDMISIDINSVNCKIGDEVILMGNDHAEIYAENLTQIYGGSSYELLCQVGRRAKRYYYENGKMIASSPLLRRDFVSFDYSDDKLNKIIETAIEQRLQSKEISNLIYSDLLKHFFVEHDRDIHYRKNFVHTISFAEHNRKELKDYYLVQTELTFSKKLQNDYFIVACANNEKLLEKYFLQSDVEYRWLLDSNLEATLFDVTSVKVEGVELYNEMKMVDGCLEIRCYHPELEKSKGKEVEFSISTKTYYPRKSHQLAIYLIEMTQGVEINFNYGDLFENVEAVPIFSGQTKFAKTSFKKDSISISSEKNEWIFPTSGVVFVY
ncbi:MAG: alanine racemase [Candidatus Cloacimonetes bacterium]|nr:alanine racemase [Candidatus Cloacimonadota bacterium]MCF7814568.1 alanine racemase [Candidatus Cloacimonadota bacterium]MCF7867766.1 alanine racemase [Candidatus Cloacimonadota bacterium]MCF7883256.1 alanine racemase [Candidatus Cloacimonadota bacterium]